MHNSCNWMAAVDLDGTLLSDEKNISNAIGEYLGEKWNNRLILVTGRNKKDTDIVIKMLSFYLKHYYVIYEDGQYIIEINCGIKKMVKTFPFLQRKVLLKVQSWCNEKKIDYNIFTKDKWYSIINSKLTMKQLCIRGYSLLTRQNTNIYYNKICGFSENEEISKIAFRCRMEDAIGYNEQLKSLLDRSAYSVYNDNKIEIKEIGTSKFDALIYLLEHLSIDTNDCIYFGNDGNDIECLKFFNNSFAVSNARDDVKEIAKFVTNSCNGDGVVEGLRKFIK